MWTRRTHALAGIGMALALGMAGCGRSTLPASADVSDGAEQPVADSSKSGAVPSAAAAMSRHYVEVIFDTLVEAEAEDPGRYDITGPGGTALSVLSARIGADNHRVILTTAGQSDVEYQLTIVTDKTADKSSRRALIINPITGLIFKGSSGEEPYVSSAIALDSNLVLVTFSNDMDDNITQLKYYEIADPDLSVLETLAGPTKTTVLLRTSPQENIGYTVRVTNVTSSNGRKLIDPTRSTAAFNGIAPNSAPAVAGAVATNATGVLLSFNKPLADDAADATHFAIAAPAGSNPASLAVVGAELSLFNTQIKLTTLPMVAGSVYRLTASAVKDRGGNLIGTANQANFIFQGETSTGNAAALPRVVGAISTSNTRVRVTFNKAMGAGLADPKNYSITGAETSFLLVREAAPGPGGTYVDLTTLSQAPGYYTVHVVNVYDLAGNPLTPPSSLLSAPVGGDPNAAVFAATAPIIYDKDDPRLNEHIDTDEDTFADWFEMLGWSITVHLANGETAVSYVTSDPYVKDTDADGIDDAMENQYSWDPRTDDTDADHLTDWDEFYVYFTDPANQDTDGDGILDELEVNGFGTSPILADTDGDGMSDSDELFERNRNPLIADLPVPQITVGDISLSLKITSSFTTESGTTESDTTTSSMSFAQSRGDTLATGSTTNTEIENNFSQEVGFEVGYDDGPVGKVHANAGFEQNRARGYSSTVNRETARQSQQEWQSGLEKALARSENRALTRNVEDASIKATVNLANRSNIAFSITNLELTVLQQDRQNGLGFRPIATLRPSGENTPTYNLGPLDGERGPIIFDSVNVFPNLVEGLLREPTGLVFKIVNYDILDEFGRNFAFSSQDVVERTAGLEIDFGGGVVEKYRVATASTFDPDTGAAMGITLQRALEIVGLARAEGEDAPLPALAPGAQLPSAIRNSYGTSIDSHHIERLTRIRGIQNDRSQNPRERLWVVMLSNPDVSRDANFSEIQLYAGNTVQLWFTTDADGDGLFAREEFLYGSSDDQVDTDGDGLSDYAEVRTGWAVNRLPGLPYKVFSDPTRADSDLDGLTDKQESIQGTDPNRADTDEDGLSDALELNGPLEWTIYDGDTNELNDVVLKLYPYSVGTPCIIPTASPFIETPLSGDDKYAGVIIPGPLGRVLAPVAGDDEATRTCPLLLPCFVTMITPGPNGVLDSQAVGSDVVQAARIYPGANGVIDSHPVGGDIATIAHLRAYVTDPLNQDTDSDGITDGREVLLGSNPNYPDAKRFNDSDGDGLTDEEEEQGWLIAGTGVRVTSNKLQADTDLDGLPDVYERAIGSNPRSRDTDGDTLSDLEEFDPTNQDHYYSTAALEDAARRCANAARCTTPAAPATPLRSSILSADSDGDGITDTVEVSRTYSITVLDMGGVSTTRQVRSQPNKKDTDDDGLDDAFEYTLGTDPAEVDTDGDGMTDNIEIGTCVDIDPGSDIVAECRNPNQADRLVTFSYAGIYVVANCDGGQGGIELEGSLFFTPSAQGRVTAYTLGCRAEGNGLSSEGGTISTPYSSSFRMKAGDSFRADGGPFVDNDGNCQTQIYKTIGTFDVTHDFTEIVGLPVGQLSTLDSAEVSSGATCGIRVLMQVYVR